MALRRANIIAADVANATTTLADITNLSFPVLAGTKYWFKFSTWFTSSGAGVGAKLTLTGPATPTSMAFTTSIPSSATARTAWNFSGTTYDVLGAATNFAITTGNTGYIEGFIIPSVSGTIIGRFAADTTGTITMKAGSKVEWHEA